MIKQLQRNALEAKASDPTGATQPDLSVVEENEGEAMKSAQTKMNDARYSIQKCI